MYPKNKVVNQFLLEQLRIWYFIFYYPGVRLKSYENPKIFINTHFKNENNKIGLLKKNNSNRVQINLAYFFMN